MKRTVKTFPYFEFPGDDFVLDAVVTIGVHVPVAFDTAVNMSYAYRKSPPGKTLP